MRFSCNFLEVEVVKKYILEKIYIGKNSLLRFIFNWLENLFGIEKSNLCELNHSAMSKLQKTRDFTVETRQRLEPVSSNVGIIMEQNSIFENSMFKYNCWNSSQEFF